MMGGMGLVWILAIVLIGVIVWAVARVGGSGPGRRGPSGKDAMEILKERYARGEIEKEEFERMKRELA